MLAAVAKFLFRLLQFSLLGVINLILVLCPMAAVTKGVVDCSTCVHTCVMNLIRNRPKVHDLLCWIDPIATGIVFTLLLTTIILLRSVSLLLLVAYAGLLGLAVVLAYKIFLLASAKLQGKETPNHLSTYLESPVVFAQDKVHSQVDCIIEHVQKWINELRRLFLIENFIDSSKLAILLWALTYIGSWLSLSAIAVLAVVYAFTVPLLMEKHGKTISKYHSMVSTKICDAVRTVDSKVPFLRLRQIALGEKLEKKKE